MFPRLTLKNEERRILMLLTTLGGYGEGPAFGKVFPGSGTEFGKKSLAGENDISEPHRSLGQKQLQNLPPK